MLFLLFLLKPIDQTSRLLGIKLGIKYYWVFSINYWVLSRLLKDFFIIHKIKLKFQDLHVHVHHDHGHHGHGLQRTGGSVTEPCLR